ncbi:hypothetical protein HC776_02405, partial [bacterium]|nr:hypothetical protein [bacterium]
LNANGTFSYTHNGSSTTSDSFTYKANDGMADSNIVTITITITGTAQTPVTRDDTAAFNTGAGVPTITIPVTSNDTFRGTPVITIVTAPAQGTAVVSGTGIQYTAPTTPTTPTTTLTYRITDIRASSRTRRRLQSSSPSTHRRSSWMRRC